MKFKILFRKSLAEEGEYAIAKKYFDVIESRSLVKEDDNIICRYSALPYYKELEQDVLNLGGQLINSHKSHQFIAEMSLWYPILKDLTPKTWFSLQDVMQDSYSGPYVLKGSTNSRKHLWKTHMFAENKEQMREVYFKLQEDGLIGDQGIVIREFEQFKNYGTALNGLPITKEFRFFVCNKQIVSSGFYWSNHPEITEQYHPTSQDVPKLFIDNVLWRLQDELNFYVFDCAEREDGTWRLVELNDGQMSGLSTINPDEFYANLKKITDEM